MRDWFIFGMEGVFRSYLQDGPGKGWSWANQKHNFHGPNIFVRFWPIKDIGPMICASPINSGEVDAIGPYLGLFFSLSGLTCKKPNRDGVGQTEFYDGWDVTCENYRDSKGYG